MKRYYFTIADTAEEVGYDHRGNIRGARRKAQELANETKENIFINDCETEDIVDCIYPD